jgi:hypothetical protein
MTTSSFPGPIFVVGIWRSGTSLLYTLLNQHSQIALTYESDLFLLRSLFRNRSPKSDWLERWEFWNNALTRHEIRTGELLQEPPDYASAATAVWKQYANGSIYGDKSPNYFDAMTTLARQFPNGRFIVIWRDISQTCRSIVQAGKGSSFFSKRGILHRALMGNARMKRECDVLIRKGVALHQIHYEEMVQSPETVMRGVCLFLDIPFDENMLSLAGADRSAIYDAPQHARVKSEKINAQGEAKAALPAELNDKIGRYVALWKKKSNGAWPVYPRVAAESRMASLAERIVDDLYFRALRAFDRFTAFVYCYAPIDLLRRYRGAKSKSAVLATQKAAALSQASNQN